MKSIVTLTAALTLTLALAPNPVAAQAPSPEEAPSPQLSLRVPERLELQLQAARAEAEAIDLGPPIALTVVSAATAAAGLVLGYATVPREGGGGCLGSMCTAGPGPSGDEGLMIAGFTVAAIGLAALIPSAIWLGLERRRRSALDREIRSLEGSISLGLGPTGLRLRGTF